MTENTQIDADVVIEKFEKWNQQDAGRASSAAETRQDIGQFVEAEGCNAKALSMARTIFKMWQKDPEKYADFMRSFEPLLEDVQNHCDGQSTPDMFEPPNMADDLPAESADAAVDDAGADAAVQPFDADMQQEVDEFNASADGALAAE